MLLFCLSPSDHPNAARRQPLKSIVNQQSVEGRAGDGSSWIVGPAFGPPRPRAYEPMVDVQDYEPVSGTCV